jgi:peptidoglycan/LPS O-acetylase OafA/YrhL
MFITLLLVTFVISIVVSSVVVYFFYKPIQAILKRILLDEISNVWARYLYFAIYVVGVSTGVRIWDLEKYVTPQITDRTATVPPELTQDRWVLEVYRTVIESLQGIAWLLLVFFIIALIAFVVMRIVEVLSKTKLEKNIQAEPAKFPVIQPKLEPTI